MDSKTDGARQKVICAHLKFEAHIWSCKYFDTIKMTICGGYHFLLNHKQSSYTFKIYYVP